MEIIIVIFGLIVGSFLNVCIYRLPREKSIVLPGSFCPSCEMSIKLYDNIPILSYILLRGRCRLCNARISIRYPMVEAITALLFLLLFEMRGLNLELLGLMLFSSLLIVISFIDLEFRIIPDVLSIGGMIAGLILSLLKGIHPFLRDSLPGVLIGGGVLFAIAYLYQLFTKRDGMGGGDIKLLAMIGAFTGIKGVIFSLLVGSLMGAMVGIPLMLIKGRDEGTKYAIPFGPFLSLGAVIYLLKGALIIYSFLRFLKVV